MVKLIEVGSKLISTSPDWEDAQTLKLGDGPSEGEEVTIRRLGVEYQFGEFEPIVWLEGFEGDGIEDAFYLSDFEVGED